ncbi:hypothetical protein B0F90DRAFT_1220345 [Multifurca ochricompacta]|uniref:Uncharacterized protein n=1 Tax=Multifurca ochricompacta TaxID=376703 RepID=A0AAD4QKT3_9AGAM|nr:hypothetical protein B0F90DRAFT_1220345 [Multifurca ochricompacta]
MAAPLDSRNLRRISTELGFLEDTLALQPENKPEHLRAWVVWLRDMDKQWSEYRGILKGLGFQEAPTGDLLGREQEVLSRKKEAETIYDRLREPGQVSKAPDQLDSTAGSTGDADHLVMVNDHTSTDAEGEPDTTASAPMIATEKLNGDKVKFQEKEVKSESQMRASLGPEENDELQVGDLSGVSAAMFIPPALGGRARRRRQETTRSL